MNTEKLKGTKTEQALINAFAGESQARNKYTFYAKKAKEEGYEQISEIFLMTAENEKEHAKLFYKHIGNTLGTVTGTYPFEMGTTEENLESAINGEHDEWTKLYMEAEEIARAEGFDEVADTFKNVRNCEEHHENRYKKLLENVKNNTVFQKDSETVWMCRKCAYIYNGTKAPENCPNCHHPRAYFEVLCEKY